MMEKPVLHNNKVFGEQLVCAFISALIAFAPAVCFSACNLPVPDVGGANVSPPNYSGILEQKDHLGIFVRRNLDGRVLYISGDKTQDAYSAYGGDEKIENLRAGVAVRVWFKGCRFVKRPSAGYVEYFSNNPLDQPPNNYFDDVR